MSFSSCFIGVVMRGHPSVFVYLATDRSRDSDGVASATPLTVGNYCTFRTNESGAVFAGCKTAVQADNIPTVCLPLCGQRVLTVASQPLASMSAQESVRPSDENEAFYLHCRAAYLAVLGSSLANISTKQQLCRGKQTSPCFTETSGPVATKMMESTRCILQVL